MSSSEPLHFALPSPRLSSRRSLEVWGFSSAITLLESQPFTASPSPAAFTLLYYVVFFFFREPSMTCHCSVYPCAYQPLGPYLPKLPRHKGLLYVSPEPSTAPSPAPPPGQCQAHCEAPFESSKQHEWLEFNEVHYGKGEQKTPTEACEHKQLSQEGKMRAGSQPTTLACGQKKSKGSPHKRLHIINTQNHIMK